MTNENTDKEQEEKQTGTNDDPKPGRSTGNQAGREKKSKDNKFGSETAVETTSSSETTSDTGITEDISERGITSQASSGERSGNQAKPDSN